MVLEQRTAGLTGCKDGYMVMLSLMLSFRAFDGVWGAEFAIKSASLVARLVTGQHGSLHEGSRSGAPCTSS